MKNICRHLLAVSAFGLMLLAPVAASADTNTTTTKTRTCYDNAYGERTCVEDVEKTEKETVEKVVVKETTTETTSRPVEKVIVSEHNVVDAALTPAQIVILMSAMTIGLAGVIYKLRQA